MIATVRRDAVVERAEKVIEYRRPLSTLSPLCSSWMCQSLEVTALITAWNAAAPSATSDSAVLGPARRAGVLRGASVKDAARVLRVSWDEAWHLRERAVTRGLLAKRSAPPTHLGVDEKAIAR